jgi:hypothetical protein
MDASEARRRGTTSLFVGLASAALFASTLFPGIGGVTNHGDSAKFQFLGVVPGVGHPPGNPLYLLLLTIVQALPWATPAVRANLLSAASGALAVGLIADGCYRIAGWRSACLAAASLALGGLFWQFATETEVYALAALFVAFVFYALVRAELAQSRFWFGAALAGFALGLSHHLSLVFALPGLAWAALRLWRGGLKPSAGSLWLAAACSIVTLVLYALLPVQDARSVYSEYQVAPTLSGLLDFVSGAKWRPQLALHAFDESFVAHLKAVLSLLTKQWVWPLWACAPWAAYTLLRRLPATGGCLALSALAWLAFVLVYRVPDPDGFLVPIVCAVAPAFGVAIEAVRRPLVPATLLAAALVPSVIEHARAWRQAVGFEVLEDLQYDLGLSPIDLPDVVARMPPNSLLALPCSHYGCVQVANYYRFADPAARARNIEVVSIAGSQLTSPWPSSPRAVQPNTAHQRVLCTVHPFERDLLAQHGAEMRTQQRGKLHIRGQDVVRVPLFCSVPPRGSAQQAAQSGSP